MRVQLALGLAAVVAMPVFVAIPAGAESPPAPPPTTPPADHGAAALPEETRCEELARRLEVLLAEHAAAAPDDVALVEAQELGIVAEELRAEGDLVSAELLLEEAIALLEGAGPAP